MNTKFERINVGKAGSIEWYTPPKIVESLGKFDLDPCTSNLCPFDFGKTKYTIDDDGLSKNWFGRVWCNPPYGAEATKWMEKLSNHNNGIALIFARTETKMFFNYVWNKADAILFIKGRLKFININNNSNSNAGAPSCLIAYGEENVKALENSGLNGKLIKLKS